jgi:hypothetical protein
MKYGMNVRAALNSARCVGATVVTQPGSRYVQVNFPGRRSIRVNTRFKTAPASLIQEIRATTTRPDPACKALGERKRRSRGCRPQNVMGGGNACSVARRPPTATQPRRPASQLQYRTTPDVRHECGEIVLGRMYTSRGGNRTTPIVIVEATSAQHIVMGLTHLGSYKDGTPRHQVPDHSACGFDRPMYVYSEVLQRCNRNDVVSHIGTADQALIELINTIVS